ncbi:MAG: hypothetical protein BAJALOKI2v1_80070 [Promethearchaeota archaeon]|nr:MAG: hypothetical protein BAJALOKI2v1_80070 [Candidatus Lokiarchaeota archaeon]
MKIIYYMLLALYVINLTFQHKIYNLNLLYLKLIYREIGNRGTFNIFFLSYSCF